MADKITIHAELAAVTNVKYHIRFIRWRRAGCSLGRIVDIRARGAEAEGSHKKLKNLLKIGLNFIHVIDFFRFL